MLVCVFDAGGEGIMVADKEDFAALRVTSSVQPNFGALIGASPGVCALLLFDCLVTDLELNLERVTWRSSCSGSRTPFGVL